MRPDLPPDRDPPPHLLIVDDEAAQVAALCDTLRASGYATTGADSPPKALQAVRDGRFAVLITDLMMPEMDGITLLYAARTIDPDIVGIVMTGHGTIGTAVEAMKSGALDYIVKPFNLTLILPAIERALTVRRLRLDNAALQRKVADRTTELEAANRQLEAFASSVSHDLRAPLRAISGLSGVLQEDFAGQLPPEARQHLAAMAFSAERMGQLIDALLRFARTGRGPIDKQAVSVAELVHSIVADLQTAEPERDLELRIGDLPDAQADPPLLRQVFVNLLSNAFKFTRHRHPAIIQVTGRRDQHQQVYMVTDNGAGFDMKYADKLFGVFQRLHRQDEFDGTGIGLSIVQRILERHGGHIRAQAEPERGATFTITLPD